MVLMKCTDSIICFASNNVVNAIKSYEVKELTRRFGANKPSITPFQSVVILSVCLAVCLAVLSQSVRSATSSGPPAQATDFGSARSGY